MSKWSSYKNDQLIMEGWRSFLNENEQHGLANLDEGEQEFGLYLMFKTPELLRMLFHLASESKSPLNDNLKSKIRSFLDKWDGKYSKLADSLKEFEKENPTITKLIRTPFIMNDVKGWGLAKLYNKWLERKKLKEPDPPEYWENT